MCMDFEMATLTFRRLQMSTASYVRLNQVKERMEKLENEMIQLRAQNILLKGNYYQDERFKLYEKHFLLSCEYFELKKELEHLKFICGEF